MNSVSQLYLELDELANKRTDLELQVRISGSTEELVLEVLALDVQLSVLMMKIAQKISSM